MFNEYDNVRNPMLGAYLLWSFVLGYFSEKNEATPLEELFIVLPMTLKEDIGRLGQRGGKEYIYNYGKVYIKC